MVEYEGVAPWPPAHQVLLAPDMVELTAVTAYTTAYHDYLHLPLLILFNVRAGVMMEVSGLNIAQDDLCGLGHIIS